MTLLNYEFQYFKKVSVNGKEITKNVVYVDILATGGQGPGPENIPDIEGFPGNYTAENTLFAQGSVFFNVASGDKFIYGEDDDWHKVQSGTGSGGSTAGVVAPAYNVSETYSKDDLVIYDSLLYVANQDINTPEAWTHAHWDQTTMDTVLHDYIKYSTIVVTCVTQDGVPVTGQTVTLRQGQEPDSPIYQEKTYDGQPISFSVVPGFVYHVSVTDQLPGHFTPNTAYGVVSDATVNVILTYLDVTSINTFDGVIAGLTHLEDPTVMARGVEINDTWTADDGTVYNDPLFVADVRNVVDENGETHLAAIMQRKWASLNMIPFDPGEQEEAKEETEPTALAGIFYYGLTGTTVSAGNLTLLTLSEGDPIPYSSYDKIFKNSIEDTSKNIQQYGHNRWSTSFYRQYLNSDQPKGQYYEQKHVGQVKPSQADSLRGYMAGCSQELLSKVKPIKISCYLNSVTDESVVEETLDTFWLPSGTEMYGSVNANEGTYFPYWKQATGSPNPFNSDSNYNKYRLQYAIENHSSVQTVLLRSPTRSLSCYVWYCLTDGTISFSGGAAYAYRCCPACAIW